MPKPQKLSLESTVVPLARRTFLGRMAGFAASMGEFRAAPWVHRKRQNFDIAVVGAGMFGSAAARHLSAASDGVALVGPVEPRNRKNHSGVYSSYYDATRLTRVIDPDLVWGTLAKRSVSRYRELEAASDIRFYTESGYMMVTPGAGDRAWFDFPAMRTVARDLAVELEELDDAALKRRFPTLRFTAGSVALLQQRDAGRLNPRALVAAQQAVALAQGTTMVDNEVTRLQPSGAQIAIETRKGDTVHANRVLIATGAFTNVNRLLPRRLDIAVRAAMVMLAEVSRDVQYDWPSILYAKTDGAETFWGLLMPPVLYPDGRRYVKTMDDYYGSRPLVLQDELRDWYRGDGHAGHHRVLRRALGEIAPELSIIDTRLVPCLITDTATHYPYIDMASERIGIVVGGNGKGAKSSDEIGRLGAEMIRTGEWPSSLPESLFAAQYAIG